MLSADAIERALVVTAHPDDVDFGAAGTVAGLVARGVEVSYCICTDGDAGGFDPAVARSEIPAIRRAEQTEAAKVLGVLDVRFLGYKDGRLEPSQDLRRDISRVIRSVRPQLVLAQSCERHWMRLPASHPDHLAAGEASINAVYPDSRNPYAHPELLAEEGLEAWTVSEVWLMGHPVNDHYVDITDFFDVKIQALRAHASQTAHLPQLEEFVRGWVRMNAEAGGLPDDRLAEAFKFVPATF